jgi:hypothetical protein
MSWTHHINDREITDYNMRSAEIDKERDRFKIRVKPPSSIILKGTDYDYMKSLEASNINDKHTYSVKENGMIKAEGEFLIHHCQFDSSQKTCKINVQAKDIYTYINENEDIKVNILDIDESNTSRIVGDIYSWYEIALVRVGQYNVPDIIDTDWRVMYYSHPVDLGTYRDYNAIVYFTEKIIVDDKTNITGWTEVSRNEGLVEYRRAPEVGSVPFDSDDVIGLDTFYDFYFWNEIGQGIILCKEKSDAPDFSYYKNNDDWLLVDEGIIELFDYDASDRESITLILREVEYIIAVKKTAYDGKLSTSLKQRYKGYELKACMNKIIEVAMPNFTGTIKSTLLFNDPVAPGEPDIYNIIEGGSSYDYVSGLLRRDKYLISKDDFIRPNSSELAVINYCTFKQMQDYLEKFKIFWHIDPNGDIRFEHESYGDYVEVGTDLRSLDIQKKYQYKSQNIPNRILVDEQEAGLIDFTQKGILNGDIPALDGVREVKEEYSFSYFTVDIDWMVTHIQEISKEGFVLVDTELHTREILTRPITFRRILKSIGKASGEEIQNAGLSLANIIYYYWRHNAYKSEFELIGYPDLEDPTRSALSIKKLKYHEINFQFDDDIDIKKFVTTFLGTGEFVTLKYPPVDGKSYKAEIRYE